MANKKQNLVTSFLNGNLDKELCRLSSDQAKLFLNQPSQNHFGRTVLHLACEYGQLEAVKSCLEFGAKPNILSSPADLQRSPLHVLIQKYPNNTVEITQLLLAYGGDPKLLDSGKYTALDYANRQNNKQLIQLLSKASHIIRTVSGNAVKEAPTMHKDIENKIEGCDEKIMDLLRKYFLKSLSSFDNNNYSLINRAIVNSNFSLAASLVEHTLEIPSSKSPSNLSPLHLLSTYICPSLFESIMAKFPRLLLSRDSEKNTPLHYACRHGVLNLVCMMLPNGKATNYVDINAANFRRLTPLHYAAREGHTQVVEYLLASAKMHCVDSDEQTFLLKAIVSQRIDLIRILLTNHADLIKSILNIQNRDGRYFLQYAVSQGLQDIVILCLELEPTLLLTGFLTIQGYKKFKSINPQCDITLEESKECFEESVLSITSSSSPYTSTLRTNSGWNSQRNSYNTKSDSNGTDRNLSVSYGHSTSEDSKSDLPPSDSFSLSVNEGKSMQDSVSEHYCEVREFQDSSTFTLDTKTYVTVLTESLLLDDLTIFELLTKYTLDKKIPITNFPDFSIAMCLAIHLKHWKAVEIILKLTYNERINAEVRWNKLFLTNEALDSAIPNSSAFFFLTDPSMSVQNLFVLDIHNNELTEIPSFVLQMNELRRLSLVNNVIETVPREVIAKEQLKELNLSGNPVKFMSPLSNEVSISLLHSKLHKLDLQNCGLDSFPAIIEELSKLHDLNLSHNNITNIPRYIWKHKGLRQLNLSHNKLSFLTKSDMKRSAAITQTEIFEAVRMRAPKKISYYDKGAARKRFQTLPLSSDSMPVKSVQRASFEHSIIPGLQFAIQQDNEISELNLSHNEFTIFPTDMVSLAPSLKKLNMSNNQLQSIYLCLIPFTLIELNLDDNQIHIFSCDDPYTALAERSTSMIYSEGQHDALNWLKNLSANNNKMDNFPLLVYSSELESTTDILLCTKEKRLIFPVLEVLSLENNCLRFLTPQIQYQSSIQEIYLDGNQELEGLPNEIGYLKCFNRLQIISVQNCPKIGNIPVHIFNQGNINTPLLMPYCRAQLKGSVKNNLVKLMVIGSFNQGKTSLLRRLKGLCLIERDPTKGVEIDSWKCDFGKGKSITFVTWDFAGQEEYYATHQCFLSTGALYILCFSLETFTTDDSTSLQNMVEWLQSIELRAPHSPIIIVGTHLDKVSENHAAAIREDLHQRFVTGERNRVEQIPDVIDVMLVSCVYDKQWFSKLNKKMDMLKDKILDIVGHLSMQYNRRRQTVSYVYKPELDPKSPTLLLNQETPKDYENLREKLFQVSSALHAAEKPPILKDSELKSCAEHLIENPDDLFDAVEHLHMQGSILHFNTPLLKDVYFLDPNWLCKQMAKVIGAHTDTNNSNGIVALSELESRLSEMEHSQFWTKFVRLLEQFQIMLRFSEQKVLIPSQLPVEPENSVGLYRTFTENLHPSDNQNYFVRLWPLIYVPHGFWPRLLCRVAQDPVIMSLVSNKFNATISLMGTQWNNLESNAAKMHRTKSDATLHSFDTDINWNFWRNGIQLFDRYGEIHFEIIQISQNNPNIVERDEDAHCELNQAKYWIEHKYRILSIVHIHEKDNLAEDRLASTQACQLFVRLTQHINSLFEAWFPGILTDYQVPSYYPCPKCFVQGTERTVPTIQEEGIFAKFIKFGKTLWSSYNEEFCFKMSKENNPISCPWHGKIDISKLAPDIKLLDVGLDRILDMKAIRLGSQLGAGTFGVVYKGDLWDSKLRDEVPCAIKLCVGNTVGKSYDYILEHMSLDEEWNSYQELRKELSPMVHLKHKNLSLLLGVTLSPLQMIMGLARKGSLVNMINEYSEKKIIFHPQVAASSILQIASGLNYLHSNNLVHLDLKAANVLVWDFPEPEEQSANSLVHLKLADYGTVLHCDTLGVRMSSLVGTPGYIAPEIVLFSGKQSFTSKADVFSFAMVIYEILSFKPPFINFESEHDQKWAPAHGRRPILHAEEKYSPCLFQDLMTACWAADPDDRPTMEECEYIARNPLFGQIRSIMSFERMVRFTSHAVITNTLKGTSSPGDLMELMPLEMEGDLTDSMKMYNSMEIVPRRSRSQSETDFSNTLSGENTQIWLGAFNNPYANKVAIVQYLHGKLGSRVWFVDVLPPKGDVFITVLTSVNKQIWLGTNDGRVLVIDGTCFRILPIDYSSLSLKEIHAIKHVEIMNKVFISFRSDEVAILNDQLEYDEAGKFRFKVMSLINTASPIYTFHPVQKSANGWEVWGTKDGCTIEVFPQLANGKLGKNFTKPLTVDPSVKYQRFHCITSCFKEEKPEESSEGYAVVWISEWQRASAYVMGAISRTLRAGVTIPKDPKDPDAIREVSNIILYMITDRF